MKNKFLVTLMFLCLLFLFGGGWPTTGIRLDTGDTPGANASIIPQVSISDSNVYVVWYDYRNGLLDIYFNYSTDNGVSWQASDIRLDTGDTPGASHSEHPKVSSSGNKVYVAWQDSRFGSNDIYFNYSTDNGATWQASDIRLDTGDTPGTNDSYDAQISSSGDNVYVVWEDHRNAIYADVYFNYSSDGGASWQTPDIQLNKGSNSNTYDSYNPQISSDGDNVYAVWQDYRHGKYDIYFNYSTDNGATWQASDIRLDSGDGPGAFNSYSPQISSSNGSVHAVWIDTRDGRYDIYFNYSTDNGATWQASDIRLDTGDTPGSSDSEYPAISSSGGGNNVYVVWNDERNGDKDIYCNSSSDGGVSWQASDIRLDTGDTPGAYESMRPKVCSNGNDAFVVWYDGRNGSNDIYFNRSSDGGTTWQASDIRLDTGDSPGGNNSSNPEIAWAGSNVYLVWDDNRNGEKDIYFKSATVPVPNIQANGSDGPITISRSDTLALTVEFDTGIYSGENADWWLLAMTPLGWYYYDLTSGWLQGQNVTLQRSLISFPSREVLNMSGLPAGTYIFFFGVDLIQNGSINLNRGYQDRVRVTINP